MGFLDRIPKHHTVAEFRRAARLRYLEAERANVVADRLIAVYLLGYSAEMTLKAAYFRVVGKGPDDPVDYSNDIRATRDRYRSLLGLDGMGNFHRLVAWAELLIAERQARGIPLSIGLSGQLIAQVKMITINWREDLRYHRNRPRRTEVDRVFQAVRWLFESQSRLCR